MKKTVLERRKQTKKARTKRETGAKINDKILEDKINEIPRLTYVQLERVFAKNKYQFKSSYIKNALQRLEAKKKIIGVLSISKEGKIVKTFFPNISMQNVTKKKFNEVNIPSELVTKEKWKNVCFLYAIRNNEFIIVPERNNKIEGNAFYKSTTKLIKSSEKITIFIPDAVIDYYQLDKDNMTWEIENDLLTILVTPKLKQERSTKKDTKLNILLLEDNPYWGDAFFKIFTNAGHTVFRAEDVSIAEDIVKNQKIDWLMLDDEIKITKVAQKFFVKLKKSDKRIRGGFITSYPITKLQREHLIQLGFNSIIEKKIDGEERDPEEIAAEQLVRIEI